MLRSCKKKTQIRNRLRSQLTTAASSVCGHLTVHPVATVCFKLSLSLSRAATASSPISGGGGSGRVTLSDSATAAYDKQKEIGSDAVLLLLLLHWVPSPHQPAKQPARPCSALADKQTPEAMSQDRLAVFHPRRAPPPLHFHSNEKPTSRTKISRCLI